MTARAKRFCLLCGRKLRPWQIRVCGEECYIASKKPRGVPQTPIEQRFLLKVSQDGPIPEWYPEFGNCYDWTASMGTHGYGQIGRGGDGGPMGAHICAWELASGEPIPDGLMVGHTCDRRVCVRNDEPGAYWVDGVAYQRYGHLWLGTYDANYKDMVAKGRAAWQVDPSTPYIHRGEDHGMASQTWETVREIRRKYATGEYLQSDLAEEYHCRQTSISRIIRHDTWQE